MKIVMVMYDTLNRRWVPNYGWGGTKMPNFRRLAERSVTFDRSYVCSIPCMPARRDLHTGRPNFLHRSWGPLEPFDDSVFEIFKEHGVYSHLTTDHYHYFEDGGLTYHQRYDTWQFNRGQEGDPWIGQVAGPLVPELAVERGGRKFYQDFKNRAAMREDHEHYQSKTFRDGLDFIDRNADEDNWVLQIETFDPHEPYFSHRQWKDRYPEHFASYRGGHFDWPPYKMQDWPEEVAEHCRHELAALMSKCDAHLGDVLDKMDAHEMWDDTMLIVWTHHGFFMGEREMWGKMWCPMYEQISHTPFFVWDPRSGKRGERRQALVQPSIDLAPTMLGAMGLEPTPDMLGKDLGPAIADDRPVRDVAMFGVHGHHMNVTDGRYVYMRGTPEPGRPIYEYTQMPTHMVSPFDVSELQDIQLAEPFSFTKGCRTMKIASRQVLGGRPNKSLETMLFDLESDPWQERPIEDGEVEARLIESMRGLMAACDAPGELYDRFGLTPT